MEAQTQVVQKYPCEKCGAELQYEPGTVVLKCAYCGHETRIAPTGTVEELPLESFFDRAVLNPVEESEKLIHCNTCAAEFTVAPNEVTKACPFCGSVVLVDTPPQHRIAPNAVLPFVLRDTRARDELGKWLGSRFWAPNDLKKLALKEGRLKGMYIPYWTFDSDTTTDYTGMRGIHYYETQTYTDSNGQTRTRQVRRTRWYPASGTVYLEFDDVLVLGSDAVPSKYGQRMQEWDLDSLSPWEPKFLVGFQALRYDRDLATCWANAQEMMQPIIDMEIRRDIGGDEQQIHTKDTSYDRNTFKHVLLPMYAASYRYRGKTYRVLVNGRNGTVHGEAPISFWKVFLAVLLGLIVLGTVFYFYNQSQSQGSGGQRSMPSGFSPDSVPGGF